MSNTTPEIETEDRLHEHRKELLREEFQYRNETGKRALGLVEVASITVAIMLEVAINLLHSLLPLRMIVLLSAAVAICAAVFVIWVRSVHPFPDKKWNDYRAKREAEFERHEKVLHDLQRLSTGPPAY